jgi:hypothetical protein
MSDPRIEYVESLHKTHEAHQQIMMGANMIVAGGVDGIKSAAEEAPELIINVITVLVALIDQMHEEHLRLAENYMELGDQIDSLITKE